MLPSEIQKSLDRIEGGLRTLHPIVSVDLTSSSEELMEAVKFLGQRNADLEAEGKYTNLSASFLTYLS